MTNIQLFNQYTAQILSELYSRFPERISLDPCKISGHEEIDDFGQIEKQAEVCLATITWLSDFGLIRVDECDQQYCRGCVLTPKGLELLNAVPEGVKDSRPLGEKLVRFIRQGALDVATETVKATISSLVAGA